MFLRSRSIAKTENIINLIRTNVSSTAYTSTSGKTKSEKTKDDKTKDERATDAVIEMLRRQQQEADRKKEREAKDLAAKAATAAEQAAKEKAAKEKATVEKEAEYNLYKSIMEPHIEKLKQCINRLKKHYDDMSVLYRSYKYAGSGYSGDDVRLQNLVKVVMPQYKIDVDKLKSITEDIKKNLNDEYVSVLMDSGLFVNPIGRIYNYPIADQLTKIYNNNLQNYNYYDIFQKKVQEYFTKKYESKDAKETKKFVKETFYEIRLQAIQVLLNQLVTRRNNNVTILTSDLTDEKYLYEVIIDSLTLMSLRQQVLSIKTTLTDSMNIQNICGALEINTSGFDSADIYKYIKNLIASINKKPNTVVYENIMDKVFEKLKNKYQEDVIAFNNKSEEFKNFIEQDYRDPVYMYNQDCDNFIRNLKTYMSDAIDLNVVLLNTTFSILSLIDENAKFNDKMPKEFIENKDFSDVVMTFEHDIFDILKYCSKSNHLLTQ